MPIRLRAPVRGRDNSLLSSSSAAIRNRVSGAVCQRLLQTVPSVWAAFF
nr:MAG TPA: hypothetical protein [Caudoviricetes sp.]